MSPFTMPGLGHAISTYLKNQGEVGAQQHHALLAQSLRELDRLNQRLESRERLLQSIAAVAHAGGLMRMSEAECLILLRKLSLQHFRTSATPEQMRAAISTAMRGTKGGAG